MLLGRDRRQGIPSPRRQVGASSRPRARQRLVATVACALALTTGLVLASHEDDHFSDIVVVYQGEDDGFETGHAYFFPDEFFDHHVRPGLPEIVDELPHPGTGGGGATVPDRPECSEALANFWQKIGNINWARWTIGEYKKTQVTKPSGEPFLDDLAVLDFFHSAIVINIGAANAILTAMEAMDCDMPASPA